VASSPVCGRLPDRARKLSPWTPAQSRSAPPRSRHRGLARVSPPVTARRSRRRSRCLSPSPGRRPTVRHRADHWSCRPPPRKLGMKAEAVALTVPLATPHRPRGPPPQQPRARPPARRSDRKGDLQWWPLFRRRHLNPDRRPCLVFRRCPGISSSDRVAHGRP